MWKTRTKVIVLAAFMGTSFAAGVFASDGIKRVDAFLRPDFNVVVDGKTVKLAHPPLIYNDASYLPVKDLAQKLNADVHWDGRTKSIYVNSRFSGQPASTLPDEGNYKEIVLDQPYGYTVTYLGATYSLLSIRSNYDSYFRVKDLAQMGVDTRGVTKAKEKYTGDLYVQQDEAMKLWKQMPQIYGSVDPVIWGEADADKVKFLKQWAKETLPLLGQLGVDTYYSYARVFAIDAAAGKENTYFIFSSEEKGIAVYVMELDPNTLASGKSWVVKSISKIELSFLPKYKETMK